MKRNRTLASLLLVTAMVLTMALPVSAEGGLLIAPNPSAPTLIAPPPVLIAPAPGGVGKDIVILHTNDVHCGIEDGLGYAGVAAYADEMRSQYGAANVTLVDAGDAVQGGPLGTLTRGEALVNIMNQMGYAVFAPGNHEFDYQVPRLLELMKTLQAQVVSSNFVDLTTGESVFRPYTILSYGDVQVAYVGITTPWTFSSSTPTYFQNESGAYIYSFCEDLTGQALYDNVQASVDQARAEGADYVVAVAHLGIEDGTGPWRSVDVIANTTGIDVMIDGHSHDIVEGLPVSNKEGRTVLLNQTGTKLATLGKIVIDPDTNTITAELVKDYAGRDERIQTYLNGINAEFEQLLGQVVARSEVELTTVDGNGQRIIRSQETNLGDLCADAYRTVLGADVGLVNGGGIRADIPAGDVTYGQIIRVHPYSNQATSVRVSGQTLLDCLEMGIMNLPGEDGSFQHVSGLTYTIDTTIPSSVVTDDKGSFVAVDGPYRVRDVMVDGRPLDPEKLYVVASHDYLLLNSGGGMVMFKGAQLVKDRIMPDNELLLRYIRDELGGVIDQRYANPDGQGRITVLTREEQPENTMYVVERGQCLWSIAREQLGSGSRWDEIYRLNQDEVADPDLIFPGQQLRLPA